MTAPQLLRHPADQVRDIGGDLADGAVIRAHLSELAWRQYRPGTIEQRARTLQRLIRTGVDPATATTSQLQTFLGRPQADGRPLSPASIVAELSHLRGFYRWLVETERRDDDPTVRIVRPRTPHWLPRPIGEDDLALAVTTASDRVRPMLLLAAYAGLRACEIAPLRGEDVRLEEDPPTLWVGEGKGGHPGVVAIAPVLAGELAGMPRRGWLFPRRDGREGPIPAHRVSHLANAHLHRVGVSATLHSLRHRFGTQVMRASGRDLRQTQEMMRHRSIVSTTVYTAVDQSEQSSIVAALPELRPILRAV